MSQLRRWTWRHAIVAAACLVALLAPLGIAGSVAAVGPARTLSLDPPSSTAGVQVTATAAGFSDCVLMTTPEPPVDGPTVDAPPAEESPGIVLRLMRVEPILVRTGTTVPGTVGFLWDGVQVAEAPVSGDTSVATFTVPVDASVGDHTVSAVCLTDKSITVSTNFVVGPPEETTVTVPALVGLTLAEAERELRRAELFLGDVTGPDGEVVRTQVPEAGTEAERGSTVDVVLGATDPVTVAVPDLTGLDSEEARSALEAVGLELGAVTGSGVVDRQSHAPGTPVRLGTAVDVFLTVPGLVAVPRLVGLPLDRASALLADSGLVLGEVAGEDPGPGDVVRRQRPAPGTLVPSGSAVTVSVEPGLPPETLVAVPDLVGGTVAEARAALDAVALRLETTADDDATVEGQSPAAGALVPQGASVAVTITEPASGLFAPPVLWGLLVLVGIGAAASVMGARAARSRGARRWPAEHVRVVAGDPRPPTYTTEEPPDDASARSRTIRLEPRADGGTHTLEEVDR